MTTVEYTFTPIEPGGKVRTWTVEYRFRWVAWLVALFDDGTSSIAGWTNARILK